MTKEGTLIISIVILIKQAAITILDHEDYNHLIEVKKIKENKKLKHCFILSQAYTCYYQ
jgi:16S rRNA U1498 N3-methylase RsmE